MGWEQLSFSVPAFEGEASGRRTSFEGCLEVCLAIVDTAFANPVLPSSAPAVPEEVRDASRVACNASVVHQADRMLRDLVGKKMREFRESTSEGDEDKDAVQVRSKELNGA